MPSIDAQNAITADIELRRCIKDVRTESSGNVERAGNLHRVCASAQNDRVACVDNRVRTDGRRIIEVIRADTRKCADDGKIVARRVVLSRRRIPNERVGLAGSV